MFAMFSRILKLSGRYKGVFKVHSFVRFWNPFCQKCQSFLPL